MSYKIASLDIQTLRNELKKVDNELINFSLKSDFKNIVLIGNTGAGKSTFICYGLGVKLDVKQKGNKSHLKFQITSLSENEIKKQSPKIGNTSLSETSIPKSFINLDEKINFIDTPGHMSSIGKIFEIRDSYANSKIFQKGKSIRLVIMMDYNTLDSDRGQGLIKNVKKIKSLFPVEFQKVMKSSHILISKVGAESIYDQEITQEVRNITMEQKESNLEDSDIYNAILDVCKQKRVICFRYPHMIQDGQITQILSIINKIPSVQLGTASKLEISAEGKILIEQMVKRTKKQVQQIQKYIHSLIDSRTHFSKGANVSVIDNLKNQIKMKNDILANISAINSTQEQTLQVYDGFIDSMRMTKKDKDNFLQCMQDLQFCRGLYQDLEVKSIANSLLNKLKESILLLENELQKHVGEQQISKIKIQEAERTQQKMENIIKINQEARMKSETNHLLQILQIQKLTTPRYSCEIF